MLSLYISPRDARLNENESSTNPSLFDPPLYIPQGLSFQASVSDLLYIKLPVDDYSF